MYRANMRTLLAPLELDGTIDSSQLELLLANLESTGWQEDEVDLVISKRLGERKERYFDNLREMSETMVKLGKVSRALDKEFQASLDRDPQVSYQDVLRVYSRVSVQLYLLICVNQNHDPVAHAARSAKLKANDHIKFELKRVTYTLTMYKREALLDDIQRCNNTLKDFLSIHDGVHDDEIPTQRTTPRIIFRYYKTLLTFWKHADCIHRLMQTAWKCSCSSIHCVNIQLDPRNLKKDVSMDMIVRFCDNTVARQTRLWEKLSLSISHHEPPTTASLPKRPLGVNFNLPNTSMQPINAASSKLATTLSTNPATLSGASIPSQSLCLLAQRGQALSLGACVCTLSDDKTDASYGLFRASSDIDSDVSHSLADILSRSCSFELLHMHRLMLAYSITHAFLRFGATPWLDDAAMSKALHLPISPDGQTLLHKQSFVLSHFHHTATAKPNENTFAQIGILLLELCFNKTLEQHPQWQAWQQLPGSMTDPVLRLAVASTWARTVEDVWSLEGAQAVNWCLHSARPQNDKWREEFASNVVEPLRNLCKNAGLDIDKRPD
jgi:hypothetical protein